MLKRAADLLRITAQTLTLGDGDLETTCPKCGAKMTLADASVTDEKSATVYRCRRDNEIVALITEPGTVPVESSGYRLEDYVLRNRSDLLVPVFGTPHKMLFPASNNALHDWETRT